MDKVLALIEAEKANLEKLIEVNGEKTSKQEMKYLWNKIAKLNEIGNSITQYNNMTFE